MSHPCMNDFWGEGADLLIRWLDDLDAQLGQPAPLPSQSVCHLTQVTYESLNLLRIAIEQATDMVGGAPQLCTHDVVFDPVAEEEFRQLTQVMISLLVADKHDDSKPDKHDPNMQVGWMNSGPNNPELGSKKKIVGEFAPPGGPPDFDSLLGRIKNSLGS
jgi:hypothetical protein